MKAPYTPPITPKTLLSKTEFVEFRHKNRRWYFVLSFMLIIVCATIALSIIDKSLDVSMLIGGLVFAYCVPLGVLAVKNEHNVFLWVILTIMTAPMLGFLVSHLLMTRLGFKHKWL